MGNANRRISLISRLNFFRLFYRGALLLGGIVYYILVRVYSLPFIDLSSPLTYCVIGFITLSFVVEMILRFIPAKADSMGSQKQFKRNYKPSGESKPELQSWKATLAVAASWLALNGTLGALYLFRIIDQGIMVLISLAYSVCDMICILFFCPFQTWMMHNRCCASCRIYNWDYAMMFTPLVFVLVTPTKQGYLLNPFALVLVLMSLGLLLKWEITYRVHPERFSEATNQSLRCANCQEKLCAHKKQLQKLLAKRTQWLKQRLSKETNKRGNASETKD